MEDDGDLVQVHLIVLADFELLVVKGNFTSHENVQIIEIDPLWNYEKLNSVCIEVARTMAPSEIKHFEDVFICHPETQTIYPDENVTVSCGDLLVVVYHSENGHDGSGIFSDDKGIDSDEEYEKMFNLQDTPPRTKFIKEAHELCKRSDYDCDTGPGEKASVVESQTEPFAGHVHQRPVVSDFVTATALEAVTDASKCMNTDSPFPIPVISAVQKTSVSLVPTPSFHPGNVVRKMTPNEPQLTNLSTTNTNQLLPPPPTRLTTIPLSPPESTSSMDSGQSVPIAIPVVFGEGVQDIEQSQIPSQVGVRISVQGVPKADISMSVISAGNVKDPHFTTLQQDVFNALTSLGFVLQPSQVKQLCLRGTSVDACTMYYIDNMHLFPPEAGAKDDDDGAGIREEGTPGNAVKPAGREYENLQPHPAFTELQNRIWSDLVSTGIVNLTAAQIVAISKKSSTVEGCVEYYFSYPELFDVCKVPPLPGSIASAGKNSMSSSADDGRHVQQKHQHQYLTSPFDAKPAWAGSEYGMAPVQRVCCICQDEFNMDDMYILDCRASHSLCIACLAQYIRINVLGDNTTQPHIPACPLGNGPNGCNHLLDEREVLQVVNMAMRMRTEDGEMMLERGVGDAIQRGIRKLYLAKAHRDANHMQCVNCSNNDDESAWFALPPGATAMRVCCPNCDTDFCSQCRRSPCHYRCACDEVVAYSRAWNEWLQGGQDAYIAEMRRQRQQYQAEHADYENKRKEIAAANDRFQELQQYEQYKAQRCKLCPKCRRTIEKLEGCDAMICGQNYHGGDIQNGCGHHFNWTTAPAYVADVGHRKVPAEHDVPAPVEAQQVRHEICHGMPLPCDNCNEPIVGPCIRCINCPSYSICLQCSASNQLHSGSHKETHICTVVFRNEGF